MVPCSVLRATSRREGFEGSLLCCEEGGAPEINDVAELYRLLREAGFRLPENVEEQLYTLNKYYTVTRYPDAANGLPSESVDRLEAERAVRPAEEVIEAARRRVEEAGREAG